MIAKSEINKEKCIELLTTIRALHNFPTSGNWVILEMGLTMGVITKSEYDEVYQYLLFHSGAR